MSTSVIEPGTRLAGRYRLEERVSEAGGSTVWKAMDETLARLVSVRTFAPGFPRVSEVVTAARAASRLTDPRLAQVFDAEDNTERAYVVSEWISGESLDQLLASGSMDPGRAVALVLEAAEALTAAHSAGLAHLWLTPAHLLWTTGGTVKITGLGVIAALSGVTAEDPSGTDTQGLGKLLYAALTSYWPGPEETTLRVAPQCGDYHCPPRQVRSDISPLIDEIACRALPPAPMPAPGAFTSPTELAAALRKVPRTPPSFASPPPRRTAPTRVTATNAIPPPPPVRETGPVGMPAETQWRQAPHGYRREPGPRGPVNRTFATVAGVVVVLVLAVLGWQLLRGPGEGGPDAPSASGGPAKPKPKLAELSVANAAGFDPAPGDGAEHNEEARRAVDGKPGTEWNTEGYNSADLGGLKGGVGLLLDMGKPVKVSTVKVARPGLPGARIELRVGDDPSSLRGLQKVTAAQTAGGGTMELRPAESATGQYVLVWFTQLTRGGGGKFRGQVGDVVVYGAE